MYKTISLWGICLAVLCGSGAVIQWLAKPSIMLVAGIFFLGIVCILRFYWPLCQWLGYSLVAAAYFSLSVMYWQSKALPPHMIGQKTTITARVIAAAPALQPKTLDVQVLAGDNIGWSHGRLRLYNKNNCNPLVGQTWKFTVKILPIRGYASYGVFDQEKFLFSHHIQGVAEIWQAKLLHSSRLACLRVTLLQYWQKLLIKVPHKEVLFAILSGEKFSLSAKQRLVLTQTGTSHLLAVSGLHLSLVAYFASKGCTLFWYMATPTFISKQSWQKIIGLLCATLYAWQVGWSLATKRAWIMLLLYVLIFCLRQHYSIWQRLLLTGLIMFCLDPLYILQTSFWLSIIAVFWLAYTGVFLKPRNNTIVNKIYLSIYRQLVLWLGLTPLLAYLGMGWSWVSLIANCVVVPWFAITIVPLTLLGALTSSMGKISNNLFWLANHCVDIMWYWLFSCSAIEERLWHPNTAITIVGLCFGWLAAAISVVPGLGLRLMAILAWLPVMFPATKKINGTFALHVLDVGQGLAVVLQTKRHTLVYDTGNKLSQQHDLGKLVVLPWLHYQGIKKVDLMMISHPDLDHSGGASSVYAGIPVLEVLAGQAQAHYQLQAKPCYAGQSWRWDGVLFEVLHPMQNSQERGNNRSCVLKISSDKHSVLLAGDIETSVEKKLLSKYNLNNIDVLVVPHHGSLTSSHNTWVQTLMPKYAIISAGYLNKYRHPKKQVIQRYLDVGSHVVQTALAGTISIQPNDKSRELQANCYRINNRHFWQLMRSNEY